MDGQQWVILILLLTPALIGAWRTSQEERRLAQDLRRSRGGNIHYHSKRHMLPSEADTKRRDTIQRSRDLRKKPSGNLTPLQEDDMDNEEVVSVAIGPPPMRPKYDKINWKHPPKAPVQNNSNCSQGATNLVKDVLTQLGREFLTHDVNEDFVFGQYVGNIMRNLTKDLRLRMQHEILDLVVNFTVIHKRKKFRLFLMANEPKEAKEVLELFVRNSMTPRTLIRGQSDESSEELNGNLFRSPPSTPSPRYQRMNRGEALPKGESSKEIKVEKKLGGSNNDTDEGWPDFSNLAKIVG